jgi:TonB family protein
MNLTNGLGSAAFVGHDSIELKGESRNCDLVMAEYPADDKYRRGRRTRLLCIDPDTRLILHERAETDYPAIGKLPPVYRIQTTTFSTVRRNPELEPDLFTFVPPEGSTTNDGSSNEPNRTYELGEGITPPVLLEKRDPEYPKKAVKAGIEGTVLLYIEVFPDGKAHNIRVLHSLDPDLDRKAMECVAAWKFRPGTKDGLRVTVAASIEVNFRIERIEH